MKRFNNIPSIDKVQIVQAYRSGLSIERTAREFDLGEAVVRRILKEHRVVRSPPAPHCPRCQFERVAKDGTRNNKQRYECRNCGYKFVKNPRKKPIPFETKQRFDNLLLEDDLTCVEIASLCGISYNRVYAHLREKCKGVQGNN